MRRGRFNFSVLEPLVGGGAAGRQIDHRPIQALILSEKIADPGRNHDSRLGTGDPRVPIRATELRLPLHFSDGDPGLRGRRPYTGIVPGRGRFVPVRITDTRLQQGDRIPYVLAHALENRLADFVAGMAHSVARINRVHATAPALHPARPVVHPTVVQRVDDARVGIVLRRIVLPPSEQRANVKISNDRLCFGLILALLGELQALGRAERPRRGLGGLVRRRTRVESASVILQRAGALFRREQATGRRQGSPFLDVWQNFRVVSPLDGPQGFFRAHALPLLRAWLPAGHVYIPASVGGWRGAVDAERSQLGPHFHVNILGLILPIQFGAGQAGFQLGVNLGVEAARAPRIGLVNPRRGEIRFHALQHVFHR